VIPRFPTESASLRLLYAILITASRSWEGVRIPSDIWFEIELLRREAFSELNQRVEKELVAVKNASTTWLGDVSEIGEGFGSAGAGVEITPSF